MARIFTTQFRYNHQSYDAIVTVITKEDSISFNVKVLDLDLHLILPGGSLSYEEKSGLKNDHKANNQISLSLMNSISQAIDKHLASID